MATTAETTAARIITPTPMEIIISTKVCPRLFPRCLEILMEQCAR
jgi:hypothetical protein